LGRLKNFHEICRYNIALQIVLDEVLKWELKPAMW
jgi:hypothetical protein